MNITLTKNNDKNYLKYQIFYEFNRNNYYKLEITYRKNITLTIRTKTV